MAKRFKDFIKETTDIQYFTGKNTVKSFTDIDLSKNKRSYDSDTYKQVAVDLATNKENNVKKEDEDLPDIDINYSDEILSFESFIKESESESEYDLDFFKYAYRWVGQAGLFQYFYGDIDEMFEYVMNTGPIKDLPSRVDEMETSYDGGIPMTVDPGYIGEPISGDANIRMVFDLQKLIQDHGKENIQNLLTNGEAEFRIMKTIKDWTKYLIRLDLSKTSYKESIEDDYGDWRAIKEWLPKDIKINLFDERFVYDRNLKGFNPQISKIMQLSNGKEQLLIMRRLGDLK